MGNYFLGQIVPFAGSVTPRYFAPCDGRMLPINQNQALFSLIGTMYGGNGTNNFALPDLRGTVPIDVNGDSVAGISRYSTGQRVGSESIALTTGQMPSHLHPIYCNASPGNTSSPKNAIWAQGPNSADKTAQYSTRASNATMAAGTIQNAGSGQPHPNIMPSLVINYIICVSGVYPPRD